MSVEADLAKARRKPIPEDKMRDLLVKARKKATGSFTLAKVVQMLDLLGWEMEPVYGWVPYQYISDGEEVLVQVHGNQNPTAADVEHMERKREEMLAVEHTELPEATPETVGHQVVMDVGPLKKGYADLRLFYHKQWTGVEGIRFTSPRGDSIDVLPGRGDVVSYHHYVVTDVRGFAETDVWRALYQLDIEEDIAAALGMEKHVPAEQRTRENTGTCAHCWGNYKLDDGRFVLHGYKRPRFGYVVGQCLGVGYEPLEVSVDGAVNMLQDVVMPFYFKVKKIYEDLSSGNVIEIETGRKNETIKKGQPHFEVYLRDAVRRAKRDLESIETDVKLYEKVIEKWHERPMPKSGEMQRGPGFFTK